MAQAGNFFDVLAKRMTQQDVSKLVEAFTRFVNAWMAGSHQMNWRRVLLNYAFMALVVIVLAGLNYL